MRVSNKGSLLNRARHVKERLEAARTMRGPEADLWLAVLSTAVDDYFYGSFLDMEDAMAYFYGDNHNQAASMLGIDPGYIRMLLE